MATKIVLFSRAGCAICQAEKAWLQEHGFTFDEYDAEDVAVQQELRELSKRVQRRLEHLPITVVNGQVYEGFDPAAMEEILA
jgi:glutaredoxin